MPDKTEIKFYSVGKLSIVSFMMDDGTFYLGKRDVDNIELGKAFDSLSLIRDGGDLGVKEAREFWDVCLKNGYFRIIDLEKLSKNELTHSTKDDKMRVYKIRDKVSGMYSSGGTCPKWKKDGKTWNKLAHIKAHLKCGVYEWAWDDAIKRGFYQKTSDVYNNAEVVCVGELETFELEEIWDR